MVMPDRTLWMLRPTPPRGAESSQRGPAPRRTDGWYPKHTGSAASPTPAIVALSRSSNEYLIQPYGSGPHFASSPPPPPNERSRIGTGTHLPVESRTDNGIDPDDTAPHLSPHRKDALRAPPFSHFPSGVGSRPRAVRQYSGEHRPPGCGSPRPRNAPKHQHHTVTVQRIQRGRFRSQPGDRAGHRRTGQTSDISVLPPALLPIPLILGGHQAGGEHGGRSGQALSPFCGSSARIHGRVVT